MIEQAHERAVAIVGVAAVMPDAPDAATFWRNIVEGRYSICDVPAGRWDPALYYDPDPAAPDKTYSRIGGWVREFDWDPVAWKLPVPPRVAAAMDDTQKWAVSLARAALLDYGWPQRRLDGERTAVVVGNAMAGEQHYRTSLRVNLPEFTRHLERSAAFACLAKDQRESIIEETAEGLWASIPPITEDTMPGELANIISGRIANLFDLHGPSYVTDAACASGLAAMASAVEGLINGEYDAVLTGGIDRNMAAHTFVKFCKIGALSATGTRPYAHGADGFVMGEGGTLFLLKRLADAERDGDRIYAVLLGVAGSSDGRGKGITAPNPAGQRLAVARAWRLAGTDPSTCSLIEGHGTSTAVGDVAEVEALHEVFGSAGVPVGSIPLGSVKSNIGHLKGAAGTAGVFKAAMALHHKLLPPTLNAEHTNPNIDFDSSPLTLNTELRTWDPPPAGIRRAGVSAFGFGGTNFHAVLEEYVPGRHRTDGSEAVSFAGVDVPRTTTPPAVAAPPAAQAATGVPPRGALLLGATDEAGLVDRLRVVADRAARGDAPSPSRPAAGDLAAPVRIAIDYGDAGELADKATRAIEAIRRGNPAIWSALRAQGVFLGHGPSGKVAFLYTGQGSQYVNMLDTLRRREPVVADTFARADAVLAPLLGKPLTDYIFVDYTDPDAVAHLEQLLLETEITQPAVLATDLALTRLLATFGVTPDLVMGHSLGEYGALVAADAMSFEDALEAVSARGAEMAQISVEDNGAMAAVFAPLPEIHRVLAETEGYVVVANVNSPKQAVIGGATAAVHSAIQAFTSAGRTAIRLPVSHAFHTAIIAPAGEPLRRTLTRFELRAPTVPVVANVDGSLYPTGPGAREKMIEILTRQVASPVQFVKGLQTLYDQGVRVFVEVGPKKALHGFVVDTLGDEHDDVVALFTNHPKQGDLVSFNQALCGLYAAGLGAPATATEANPEARKHDPAPVTGVSAHVTGTDRYAELGQLVAEFLERGHAIWTGATTASVQDTGPVPVPVPVPVPPGPAEPVVITGAAVGLPGTRRVFADENLAKLLGGQQFIRPISESIRKAMADKHITRLVKSEQGAHRFDAIDSPDDVIKLAARAGSFDLVAEFGVDEERDRALDECTRLAIGVGFDALRDAGIPLVLHYKQTSLGTRLPDRWGLPDAMRDDTGIIFASAFPGYGEFAAEIERCLADRHRRDELAGLRAMRSDVDGSAVARIDRRIGELETELAAEPFEFDRRFLFRVLSMGHSQFAEIIGARGPNTQVNAACASTTQAIGLAEDWIRAGRCRRVVIVAADDVTSDTLLEWMGSGFLASGAAATDAAVEDAALPFDNRRHGMLLGMGAAGIVVESADAAAQRGVRPICEVLATVTANSAFHGTKLDVQHISSVMESLVTQAARRGVDRYAIAPETVFVSHETYTPARGGSAQAEVDALRTVFGAAADQLIIANTKGFTGHPMGVGIEDVIAVKALETGLVPPVPNFREVDPNLGSLHLSTGGDYPVRYALRLAAGFGSQISMVLLRWTPVPDGRHRAPDELGYAYRIVDEAAWRRWLTSISGTTDATLEVVQRRLRVAERQPVAEPVRRPEPEPIAATAPEPSTVDAAADEITEVVLSVVADKTGYPADMLELDLDLEADLGVDTVKQAEVFARIRERFEIPRDDQLRLRDYPTLAHVIDFVRQRRVATAPAKEATRSPGDVSPADNADRVPRRVPVPTIRPPLDVCLPTGVTLTEGTRVVVGYDRGGAGAALAELLRVRGVQVLAVDDQPDADDLTSRIDRWLTEGPVHGVYWLPALDHEGTLDELDLDGWREANRVRVKLLYTTMRRLYEHVATPGTFLVTATRLGGRHGYDELGAYAPLGGAVTGFTKAYARERSEALVKAVDFGPTETPDVIARALVAETLRDPGAVEIGHADDLRWTVTVEERPIEGTGMRLGQDTVFVVTGAAGSIVSAITADLAAASGGIFHLLDLTPEPNPDDPDMADVVRFTTDVDGLKADLVERLRQAGKRPTPVLVDRELAKLERLAAAQAAIEAVRGAGGQAHYHSVDLTDATAVTEIMDEVLATHGRVDVLLHAAGVDASHALPDKEPGEYDLVFDVKGDGWFNVLRAIGDRPLGATVAFSSVAGRFGNLGQTDYSAANDLLCKLASAMRTTRPGTRAIAIDWTAWAGIGMASRGSIPKVMAQAGIELLAPEIGVPTIRRELTGGAARGEMVVAGRLGALAAERADHGGVDPELFAVAGAGPMIGTVAGMGVYDGLVVRTTLDPAEQPFLHDHRIDGTPVLPGVLGIEAFAEVAALPLPGWQPVEIDDVEFHSPCKFYRDQPRELTITATFRMDGDGLVARCRLFGVRQLPNEDEPRVTTHFAGTVRLSRRPVRDHATAAPPSPDGHGVTSDAIYGVYFHGPAFQVLERAWLAEGHPVGLFAENLPADHVPAQRPELVSPRLIELFFQTAGVWEIGRRHRFGLPSTVDKIVLHSVPGGPHGRVEALVTAEADGFDGQVVDESGAVLLELSGYRTIALPDGADPVRSAPLADAMTGPDGRTPR